MQHQKTASVWDIDPPLTEGEIQRFSQRKGLPYKSTAAVLHAIDREYGTQTSIMAAGLYSCEGLDMPLSRVGFDNRDPIDVIRKSIDEELGLDIPREEIAHYYTFLGLVQVTNGHINGNGHEH
jgi:hypothetical protein